MTQRIPLDHLTSDQYDGLCADLDRYEELQGEMNERAIDLTRRCAQLEDLLRIAHDTSNKSEAERARAAAAIGRIQDAAALHRKGLLRITELYAVIEAALDAPAPAATQATDHHYLSTGCYHGNTKEQPDA